MTPEGPRNERGANAGTPASGAPQPYPEQSVTRMFPIKAADISRDSVFARARTATAGGREEWRTLMRDSGLRSMPLAPSRPPGSATQREPHLQRGTSFDTATTQRRGLYGLATSEPMMTTPAVREALTYVPDFPKPTPTPPRLGFTRTPRLPWETRRVQSATSPARSTKLLQQRDEAPNYALPKRETLSIPEIQPTKSEAVLSQTCAHVGTQFPSPPEASKTSVGTYCDTGVLTVPTPPFPQPSPKPSRPISAWTKERDTRKSGSASKRACFRENVDVYYYDTEERPTETESRDFEKLKDEEDSVASDETMADDISDPPANLSSQSTPNLQQTTAGSLPPVPPRNAPCTYPTESFVVTKSLCFKQEIELVPNAEDARESLMRKELRRLAIIVQIEETCIKQLTSVKAMSGGRTLIVVTHRRPAGLGGAAGHPLDVKDPPGGGGSMVLVQHVDKLRLPVIIDPYNVKAHIHKDWTLRIEAPIRDWLDCPAAVLRCRLPLTERTGVSLQ